MYWLPGEGRFISPNNPKWVKLLQYTCKPFAAQCYIAYWLKITAADVWRERNYLLLERPRKKVCPQLPWNVTKQAAQMKKSAILCASFFLLSLPGRDIILAQSVLTNQLYLLLNKFVTQSWFGITSEIFCVSVILQMSLLSMWECSYQLMNDLMEMLPIPKTIHIKVI